ncbi:chitobiosyldiphosphodolichol beta-mannosyltransferase [Asbolus verrucosus]|uniref:Chitobiosyldiphosphodolichol beta-mannosyltransferase n=1 Tax=Asbolus verrucosus TaxID=1661398 RepID=A0A482WC09_ASBVE|nr:chitobiosyldiphosphodolichol beta-mannosyltransferase [Asbolus verrucosus]
MNDSKKNVKVVVLGDIGRSPRMQYHCTSLSELGHQVDVIGYGDTEPMELPQIPIKYINYAKSTCNPCLSSLLDLYYNNWHNYAHSIMALNVGEANPLVKITKKVEIIFGHKADYNFCVTKAMREDLQAKWNIKAVTLYDRPPTIFKSISFEEKHRFLLNFAKKYNKIFLGSQEGETVFSEITNGSVKFKSPRPGLLVSGTSWTEDEDFSILLTALQEYENQCESGNPRKLPKLICVITGKGPMKEYYIKKVTELNWKHVVIITPWLDAEDYPLLLASADLGVSLHTSSSGLDLPMKVVDILNELVKNGENGFMFTSSQELSKQILDWFEDFPNNQKQQQLEAKFKIELQSFQNLRWKENWEFIAAPVFS